MGDYIFLCVLRQLVHLLVLQQVKELKYASERIDCQLGKHIDNFYYKKLLVNILSFPSICLSIL